MATYDVAVDFGECSKETVTVDPELGPRVLNLDGSYTYMAMDGPQRRTVSRTAFNFGKPWVDMNPTEREILLSIVAKKNRRMSEYSNSPAGNAAFCREYYDKVKFNWYDLKKPEFSVDQAATFLNDAYTTIAQGGPILVCFYSGGYSHADGQKLLKDFVGFATDHGIEDVLVLGFPDEYGIVGEGHAWWRIYVNKLVQEINKTCKDRKVIIYGHSRGCCSAMSLATRLGDRVLKVYVVACSPIELGKPTDWEVMSADFKKSGDAGLLKFLCDLQPENAVLKSIAGLTPKQLAKQIDNSPMLNRLFRIMRVQYKDATFPLMVGPDPDIKKLDVPIMAIAPKDDPGSPLERLKLWRGCTSDKFRVVQVAGGHVECLKASKPMEDDHLFKIVIPDIVEHML